MKNQKNPLYYNIASGCQNMVLADDTYEYGPEINGNFDIAVFNKMKENNSNNNDNTRLCVKNFLLKWIILDYI